MAGTPREETTLETERLLLEPLMPEHAAILFEDLADERLYRLIPLNAPESSEALESRYRKLSSRRSPDGSEVWLNFAMRLREEGTLPKASYVGTLEATVFPNRSAYIAYTVFAPFWRQGYAREGCARMLRHLLEEYRVLVVVAEMDTRNAASVSLAEALGFKRVGTTLGADHFKGSVSDEHRYELHVEGKP
ncbi:MAG TPA: GNAT family protein [Rubrobacter sp.]|nr:GNAT family protein [Rubrobacter sp.]